MYKGQYQLTFGRVYYSDGVAYFPFKKSFQKIRDRLEDMEVVVVLGAGIGSAAMILNEMFPHKEWECQFVDTDADVLELCAEVMEQFPKITAHFYNEDAFVFLQRMEGLPQLICVDIFDEHVVPKQFLTEHFLKLLRRKMPNEGIAIMNVMFASELQEQGFKTLIQAVFPKNTLIPTTKNQIFILYAD